MRIILYLLLVCTASAQACYMGTDAASTIVSISEAPISTSTGLAQSVVSLSEMRKTTATGMQDQWGRYLYGLSAGRVITLPTPVWPTIAALKRQALQTNTPQLELLLARISALQAWQADAGLVTVQDRSGELSAAQNRLAQIKTALSQ